MLTTRSMKYMKDSNEYGFTLLELMITLVVGSIVAAGVFAAYTTQSKTFSTQRQVSRIQQDLRGAMYMMEYDLLNACRDPEMTNQFSLTDVRYYDYRLGTLDNVMGATPFVMPAAAGASNYFASYPVLEFSSLRLDTDGDGAGDQPVTIRYQIYDFDGDGRPDLGRRSGLGIPPGVVLQAMPDLVAEGVVAIGYAFAFNQNPSGAYQITRTAPMAGGDPLGNIIWAIDTNGDRRLDTNIDVTGDGEITQDDDISGDGVINAMDGATATLATTVPIANAVAVRLWVLVQSAEQSPENAIDRNRYVVADRIIPPPAVANGFQDRFKRRVKTVTVALRNYRKS